ncbi:MAG: diguanylate cyclase, partial [Acidobacteria bacterium]
MGRVTKQQTMTERTNPNLVGEQQLRSLIDQLSDQLCQAVDGRFDFAVRVEGQDETIEKLQMLINFLLDAARRSVAQIEEEAHDLDAERQTLSAVNLTLEKEIIERKYAQIALKKREAETRAILEAAADAIVAIDERGVVATYNRAAEEMFGYPASEIIGRNISILAPSPHRERHDEYLQRYLITGRSKIIGFERELEGVRKDGTTFPISLRATEMIHNGRRSYIGIIQDITEHKRLRSELEALAKFPTENPNPIVRVDDDARIIYANPAANQMLDAWKTSPGNHLPAPWPETIAEVLAVGNSNTVEVRCEDRIYTLTMTPVVEAGYVNLFGKDITARVEAEMELRESERQLLANTEELEHQKAQLVDEIAQRMGAEAQARHDATHDTLTGLSNRAVLLDRIERCLQRTTSENDYKFALLFLDFDRFKIVNDSLGHEVGDQLLISIAERLRKSLRAGDTASMTDEYAENQSDTLSARLGGDEFVILLDEISDVTDATRVAERLQKLLEAPHKLGTHKVTSTASIGIVTSELDYDSANEMLRDAD